MAIRVSDVNLWTHQRAAYDKMVAYISAYRRTQTSAAGLVHMPTGTGKTGVIACLAQLIPSIDLTLVLTPRLALRHQLTGDLRGDFWMTVGVNPAKLSKPVTELRDEHWLPDYGRRVAVMTIQRLEREASANSINYQALLANTKLVILDEGHAEPARAWSRAVRAFSAPRILFTATPFRNDLKAFDIDFAKHAVSYSFSDAAADHVIRKVAIVPLPHPRNPAAFAQQLVTQYQAHFGTAAGGASPRVIVRCDDHARIRQLCRTLLDLGQTVVGLHEQFPLQPTAERPHERRRIPGRRERQQMDARFWVHQYKLLEGVDEPRFQMVAFYDKLRSTRAVIQQVGRVLRNPGRAPNTTAVLLDHTDGDVTRRWEGYLQFDQEVATDSAFLSQDLPRIAARRAMAALPEVAYVLGDFKRRLDMARIDPANGLRFPSTAKIFTRRAGFSLRALCQTMESEFLEMDRVFDGRAFGASTYVWWYIAVRNSRYLSEDYFLEPSFHVAVVHLTANHLFYVDSGGQVALPQDVAGAAVLSQSLRRLLHQGPDSRLTRVTLKSANIGPNALRSRGLGAYAIDGLAPGFDDHLFVCGTAEGCVGSPGSAPGELKRRYVGFANARVREAGTLLDLRALVHWFGQLNEAIVAPASKPMRGLQRFAAPGEVPADPTPMNILLDAEELTDRYETIPQDGGDPEPLEFDELCHNCEVNGTFSIAANGRAVEVLVTYDAPSARYQLTSPGLDQRYAPRDPTSNPSSVVQLLNETGAFRLLPKSQGVVYAAGAFYRPLLQFGTKYDDSRIDLLAALHPVDELDGATSEKGSFCRADHSGWEPGCVFDLIANQGAGTNLASFFNSPDLLICDDMQTESADFIAANTLTGFVAFAHAKASTIRRKYSASSLEVVVGQALKNLRYAHPFEDASPKKCEKWHRSAWTAPGVEGKVANRVLIGAGTGNEIWGRIRSLLRLPHAQKEVWLVLGNALSKKDFEAQLRGRKPAHEAMQGAYLLEGLISAAMSLSIRVRIFCMP